MHDNTGWFIVINIFIFQLFDLVGRTLPRWFKIIPARLLWVFTSARVVFGVLFILCLVPGSHRIFASNWASYVIMVFFAVTNGYCGTLAMMYGPANVLPHEKNLAGMIMSVFLQLGIFMAVLFALFLLFLVHPCGLPSFLIPKGSVCKVDTALHCPVI
jgi:equilibrative nucleoside transporter 1/2/3